MQTQTLSLLFTDSSTVRFSQATRLRQAALHQAKLVTGWASLVWVLFCLGATPMQAQSTYSWQDPHAQVLPNGDLQWAPLPFRYEKGDSVRYIDFQNGNDNNDGTSKTSAWKHHPWDPMATGQSKACKGIHTYVFKGGVVYRGTLKATESGSPDNPIRLTRDPGWGQGEAYFYGSTQIKGGWKKATAAYAPGIPDPDKVWYFDVRTNYDPDPVAAKFTCMWQVNGDQVERLHIARTPNYDFSDPNNPVKNWPTWSKIDAKTSTYYSPLVKQLKGTDPQALKDVVVWSTSPSLMGSAYPRNMSHASWDLDTGSVTTRAFGNASTFAKQRGWNYFMIENAAVLLDRPGEYFYNRRGRLAGRLYLRPAGDVNPNTVQYEMAQRGPFVTIINQSNIVISGLEFRYNDPDNGQRRDDTRNNTKPAPCILAIGHCSNITIKNNRFYDVADAIETRLRTVARGGSENEIMNNIVISDNDVKNASGAGVIAIRGPDFHPIHPKNTIYGRLLHVEVLRNRLDHTGFRGANARWDNLPAIQVLYPETCEIAGNIIHLSFGNGIVTYGGKASGHVNRTAPLIRYLVHHNRIDTTMLGCNDYGGLEHFQGGPIYLYDNISRNAVGNRSFWGGHLGYNLYLDGGFKCYAFNNILAGDVRSKQPDFYSNCGYFMVFGFMDQFFNNTIVRFINGMDGSSGNRSNIVGNLLMNCRDHFIQQNRPGDVSMMGGGDTGAMGRMGIATMSYASNVFYGHPKAFGAVAGTSHQGAGSGQAPVIKGNTLPELATELQKQHVRLGTVGVQVNKPPLVDPAHGDYRPTADSGLKGHGVKFFVPWSLAREVGQWNFYQSTASPQTVLGEGFYMTNEYRNRSMYYFIPRNDLTVTNCTADDYVSGPLEDWIEGALRFDGKKRVARLPQAELIKDMVYPADRRGEDKVTYDGSQRETVDMGTNDFLIEIVFKTNPGLTQGVLAEKMDGSGYELAVGPNGGACLTLKTGGVKATVASTVKINDGQWHHVLTEADRAAGTATIYVDGKAAGGGTLDAVAKGASLSNQADFIVGQGFAGAIDFLRVCRSTLAESKTSIGELYAWEFNGPFLRDFTGRKVPEGNRDAGAIQNQ